jgi:4-hydroxy-tetrahydrodipicolinate reductase
MNATTATSSSNNQRLRVAVAGASGRMGRMLIEAILQSDDLALTAALDRPDSPALGTDPSAFLGQPSGIAIESDVRAALSRADCLIDFTRPEGTMDHLAICAELGVKLVIGTTGFSDEQKARIAEYARRTAVMLSPNMSVGVNATLKLLDMAARLLNDGYDVEVFEAHHRNKVDAPSGTALAMGDAVANAWGKKLDDIADWARHGETGPRESGRIGFSVVRGGDIIGDHTVYFCGTGERIEITHRSSSRSTYAQGSLRAARYLSRKEFGLFDMQDVLAT